MAIVLNGTGTISGISAGGLPDGSVTADDLASGVSNPITQLDQWRLTSNQNTGTNAAVTSGFERTDESNFAKIGSGISESSGIFTFPETGIYQIVTNAYISSASDSTCYVTTQLSTDSGSNWDALGRVGGGTNGGTAAQFGSGIDIVNVTDTSTFQFRWVTGSFGASTYLVGNTDQNYSNLTFIRMGESS